MSSCAVCDFGMCQSRIIYSAEDISILSIKNRNCWILSSLNFKLRFGPCTVYTLPSRVFHVLLKDEWFLVYLNVYSKGDLYFGLRFFPYIYSLFYYVPIEQNRRRKRTVNHFCFNFAWLCVHVAWIALIQLECLIPYFRCGSFFFLTNIYPTVDIFSGSSISRMLDLTKKNCAFNFVKKTQLKRIRIVAHHKSQHVHSNTTSCCVSSLIDCLLCFSYYIESVLCHYDDMVCMPK